MHIAGDYRADFIHDSIAMLRPATTAYRTKFIYRALCLHASLTPQKASIFFYTTKSRDISFRNISLIYIIV